MKDYKQKYETAINQAKEELKACGDLNCDAARQIFRFFPELRESEDLKIKRDIQYAVRCAYGDNSNNTNSILAWLEKKGKQKFVDECKDCNNVKGCITCIDGDQYAHIEEYNPAWSKEDEKMWITISDLLWEGFKLSDGKVSWDKIRCWLLPKITYFKDRVQTHPKQEWSEEDEKFFKTTLWHISHSISNSNCTNVRSNTADWLKSLKGRMKGE